jgi:integrase
MDTVKELTIHSPGHKECPACKRASKMQEFTLSREMTFPDAFELWLEQRTIDPSGMSPVRYAKQRTERDWRVYAKAASKFFHALKLGEIHAGHLHEYQRARACCDPACGAWAAPAGANLIRKEVGLVIRILKAADCWSAHFEETFRALPGRESDVGRALTPAEQDRLLRAAASREEWRLVYWWSILALQSTMSTNELRHLHRGDIFLEQGILQVRNENAKNRFRVRTIPLTTPEAVWALGGLLERAARLGSRAAYHHLFPIHITADRYDALRPMSEFGLRKPWEAVRSAAGVPWLRMYDMRHTAITRMAEAGMPIPVIMSFAGHISPRMQQHYTTISMQAKRRWAAAAWAGAEMPPSSPQLPAPEPAWQRQAMAAGWGPGELLERVS